MKSIKKFIYDLAKRNVVFRKMSRFILKAYHKIKYIKYYFTIKTDDKVVIFETFNGRSFSDSPKYLYLEMLNNKDYKDYKFIWAFNDPESKTNLFKELVNERTTIVKTNTNSYLKSYAKAKYWIVNSKLNERLIKKKGQICCQCWHGTPLKRLGFDILKEKGNALNTVKEIKEKYYNDAKVYDYMLSPSKFCSEALTSAFALKSLNKENIIVEKGYPRNDFLFKYTEDDVLKIKKSIGIDTDKKIILYAPTWRDNQHTSGVGYTYKLGIDFDTLKKKIGDKYIILFRAHYFIANSFDFDKYKGFVYNVSNIDDVNLIYVISDILITDYSSVFFDFANLKRPMLFYMYDKEEYQNNLRDFYFSLSYLPGPIVKEEKDLIKEINEVDTYFIRYKEKYDEFNKKFNYLDSKDISLKVLKEIIK